jgi:chemotaxis response regulator CheB
MPHVVIAGGDPSYVDELAESLEAAGSVEVVGTAYGADAAVAAATRLEPDAILIEAEPLGPRAVDAVERIKALDPAPRVFLLVRTHGPTLRPLAETGLADAYVSGDHAPTIIDIVLGLAAR